MSVTTTESRKVHFVPENDVIYEIGSCHQDYTKQEILDCWYTPSQLERVGKQRSKAALQWEADKKSSGVHMRGLEHFTKAGEERTSANVLRCIDAVMDEQQLQWSTGEDDFDRIAAASYKVSRSSSEEALSRAKEDQQTAQRIYQRMQKTKNKKSKKSYSRIRNLLSPILRVR